MPPKASLAHIPSFCVVQLLFPFLENRWYFTERSKPRQFYVAAQTLLSHLLLLLMDYCTSRCIVTAMKLSPKLDQSLCLEVFAEDGRDIGTTGVSCLAGVDFARFWCTCSNRPQAGLALYFVLEQSNSGRSNWPALLQTLPQYACQPLCSTQELCVAGRIIIFHCHATAVVGPDRSTHLPGDVIVGLYCCIVVFQKHQACP